MRSLKLYFQSQQLIEVIFQQNAHSEPRQTVRGKTGGAIRCVGSFQWTSAVKALSLLMAKASSTSQISLIQGFAGSFAASLDYAVSKQPTWICEMFGCDPQGISYVRRLILRTNPERKRPGPVVLGVNHGYLSAASIEVYVDGALASQAQLAHLVACLADGPIATNCAAKLVLDVPNRKLASNE